MRWPDYHFLRWPDLVSQIEKKNISPPREAPQPPAQRKVHISPRDLASERWRRIVLEVKNENDVFRCFAYMDTYTYIYIYILMFVN